jgi:Ni,Fe-hydrogenase III small subunit
MPIDLVIPGCPPTPAQIMQGLLTFIEAHGFEGLKPRR